MLPPLTSSAGSHVAVTIISGEMLKKACFVTTCGSLLGTTKRQLAERRLHVYGPMSAAHQGHRGQ